MRQPTGMAHHSLHDPPGLVSTLAGMRRFDCTSDGSYVEIVHVSLADEAALTGDEDDEAYEGPVRNGPAQGCCGVAQVLASVICLHICSICSCRYAMAPMEPWTCSTQQACALWNLPWQARYRDSHRGQA